MRTQDRHRRRRGRRNHGVFRRKHSEGHPDRDGRTGFGAHRGLADHPDSFAPPDGTETIWESDPEQVVGADFQLLIQKGSGDPFGLGITLPQAERTLVLTYRLRMLPERASIIVSGKAPSDPPLALGAVVDAAMLDAPRAYWGKPSAPAMRPSDTRPSIRPRIVSRSSAADEASIDLPAAGNARNPALPDIALLQGVSLSLAALFDPGGAPLAATVTEPPTAGAVFARGLHGTPFAVALRTVLSSDHTPSLFNRAADVSSGRAGTLQVARAPSWSSASVP